LIERWIRSTMASMSLEQKVGQLFVAYVTGAAADTTSVQNVDRFGVATPAEAVQKFHLGGVIYFVWSGNIDGPQQIAALSNGLRSRRPGAVEYRDRPGDRPELAPWAAGHRVPGRDGPGRSPGS
jgi:beta-N-acetylhexosaminidase